MTNWSAMAKGRNDWYLAASLIKLGNEINARWPGRDTRSDGAVGDTSHQARESDHNPDWDSNGVVRAIDVDKDGIDVQELLDATIGDSRVWYVIWNGYIYSRTYNWTKRPYDGSNKHEHHVHISIWHTSAAETDVSAWFVRKPTKPPTKPEGHPLSDLTAADAALIGKAVADALTPKLDKIEQKYTIADNDYDSQRAAYEAVAQAEAAHILAGGKPHTAAELTAAQTSVWSYLRPLWAK